MATIPERLSRPQTAREIWAKKKKLPFIPTFSPKLNAILGGGLRSTGVYILTGAPGAGKSSTSLDIADAAITAGYPVIYVSAELTPELVIARYAGKKLGYGWLDTMDTEDPEKVAAITKFTEDLGDYLWVLDPDQAKEADKWIPEIHNWFINANAEAYMKQFNQEIPENLRHVNILVIVDYIQDLASTRMDRHKDQRAAVAELSRDYRNLAKDRFIPVWIISSSSRSHYAAQEEQRIETLIASAKDSGEVEYDSTAVIHIRRRDSGDFKGLEFVVAKNRFGEAMQSVVFKLNPETSALEETEVKAENLAFKLILDKVGQALYVNPGKFKNPAVLAKALNLKAADVKKALMIYEAGTYGGMKLMYNDGAYYLKAPIGENNN